jgi:hypothetical protein
LANIPQTAESSIIPEGSLCTFQANSDAEALKPFLKIIRNFSDQIHIIQSIRPIILSLFIYHGQTAEKSENEGIVAIEVRKLVFSDNNKDFNLISFHSESK